MRRNVEKLNNICQRHMIPPKSSWISRSLSIGIPVVQPSHVYVGIDIHHIVRWGIGWQCWRSRLRLVELLLLWGSLRLRNSRRGLWRFWGCWIHARQWENRMRILNRKRRDESGETLGWIGVDIYLWTIALGRLEQSTTMTVQESYRGNWRTVHHCYPTINQSLT